MSAREEILAAVREGLAAARARGEESPGDPRAEPLAVWDEPRDLEARFVEMVESVGAHLYRARDEAEALESLRAVLDATGARRVAHSDDPLVTRLLGAAGGALELLPADVDRARLLASDLGVSNAQWGVAETGTLVLESDAEQSRLVSLVPPAHLALLRTSRIVGALGELLARVSAGGPEAMSRAVTCITGPSRTADIELRLVVGVHGPKELYVILLDDPAEKGNGR